MRLLHQDASPRSLAFLTKWVFGIWLGYTVLYPMTEIAQFPQSIFQPAGLFLRILPQSLQVFLITKPFLIMLKGITIIALVLVLFNKYVQPAAVISCLLLTAQQGLIRGFGRIHHAEIILLFAAYLLTAFAVANKRLSHHRPHPTFSPNSVPFISILSFFLLTYSFIGIHRLTEGGIHLLFSDDLTFSIFLHSHRPLTNLPFNLSYWLLAHPPIHNAVKIGFPMVTLFEVFAPLCLVFTRFRYAFLAVMIPFHILTALLMHLFFWETLLLYILLFDWTRSKT